MHGGQTPAHNHRSNVHRHTGPVDGQCGSPPTPQALATPPFEHTRVVQCNNGCVCDGSGQRPSATTTLARAQISAPYSATSVARPRLVSALPVPRPCPFHLGNEVGRCHATEHLLCEQGVASHLDVCAAQPTPVTNAAHTPRASNVRSHFVGGVMIRSNVEPTRLYALLDAFQEQPLCL